MKKCKDRGDVGSVASLVCLLESGWGFVDSGAAEVADEFELFVTAFQENREGFSL